MALLSASNWKWHWFETSEAINDAYTKSASEFKITAKSKTVNKEQICINEYICSVARTTFCTCFSSDKNATGLYVQQLVFFPYFLVLKVSTDMFLLVLLISNIPLFNHYPLYLPLILCLIQCIYLFFYLYGINSGPEHWVVVFHRPPILWPVGICQIAAVLFQNV